MDNKNNTANTAKENNNTIIYAGGGLIALVVLLLAVYMFWGSDSKNKEDNSPKKEDDKERLRDEKEIREEAYKLVIRGFVSEKCLNSLTEYENSPMGKSDKQKLKDLSTTKESTAIRKAYREKKEALENLKTDISSMVSQIVASDVVEILKDTHKKLSDEQRDENQTAIDNLSVALKELEKCKDAENNTDLSHHFKVACSSIKEVRQDSVQNALDKLNKIPLKLLRNGKVTRYSRTSLEEALKKWDIEYSPIQDDYAIDFTLTKVVEGATGGEKV